MHLQIEGLYPVPQQIQGYSADDAFSLDPVESIETVMGVDGILSGGWVAKERKLNFVLQADSNSNEIMDNWIQAQDSARECFIANGIFSLPGVGSKFTMDAWIFTSFQAAPDAKKTLQPRKFTITFQTISKAPI